MVSADWRTKSTLPALLEILNPRGACTEATGDVDFDLLRKALLS